MHKKSVNLDRRSIYMVIIALFGELLSLMIGQLDLALADKVLICLVYVVICYIYMFYVVIKYKGVSNIFFLLLLKTIAPGEGVLLDRAINLPEFAICKLFPKNFIKSNLYHLYVINK